MGQGDGGKPKCRAGASFIKLLNSGETHDEI